MKKNIKLIWYIFPSYLLIVLVAITTMSLYASSFLRGFYLERTEKDLLIRGTILKNHIVEYVETEDFDTINDLCVRSGAGSETRITVIMPDGKVVGDSEEIPSRMNNHKNRPEVLTAMEGKGGSSMRISETLGIKMLYTALPLKVDGIPQAVLRISIPVTHIDEMIRRVQLRLLFAGAVVALAAALICFLISRRITRPIEELKQGAGFFADGNFDYRLYKPSIEELAGLSDAMNRMAFQLAERILTEEQRSSEFSAVLSSMTEGIIGIDLNENIINVNQAARSILEIDQEQIIGKGIQEIIRDSHFIRFVRHAAEKEDTIEDDFALKKDESSLLNIKSMPLKNVDGGRIGTLITINDVTHVRMLENIRKDFVANVSHEIKTPLTAIKGFIETIIRMENDSPEDAKRFLGIVMRHVDRLDAILEDLLTLARFEQNNAPEAELGSRSLRLAEVFETVFQLVEGKAKEKNIRLEYSISGDGVVEADRHLLEQALVNLADNAVKYSPENTNVLLSSTAENNEVKISVKDQGQGISEKHQSRIFERFYRIDKARSRKMGGTGLGLAIVKHIAQAHGGRVSVESAAGKGSEFHIHLPT